MLIGKRHARLAIRTGHRYLSGVKSLGQISGADWRRPSVIALLLANLVPVFGVFFLPGKSSH
jgi:hypothetical protein